MNKRQRGFISALAPAIDFARQQCQALPARDFHDVTGLALHSRTSAQTPAELLIYGPIMSASFWEDGISSADVAAALKEAGPGPVHVRINSPGGDVFQGTAIHTALATHPGVITVDVDGLAASAASFIMLAGDVIRAPKSAFIMIHDAMTQPYGNAKTLRKAADLLDKVSATMAEMYADRCGEDIEHWREAMTVNEEDGTWYTGTEAHEIGLVDEILAITAGEDPDEEGYVARRLDGWRSVLPAPALAFLEQHPVPEPKPEPEPEETTTPPAVAWDSTQFLDIMKGAFQ